MAVKIINYTNLIVIIIFISVIGFLYNRYIEKVDRENPKDNYGAIQKYLLKDPSLADVKKPILWIPIEYEYNARNWLSFGSRSSFELNQPYMYLTVKSIINQCGGSFHICIIDDDSIKKLLPDWTINMKIIGDPVRSKIREMAWVKILYRYGGIFVPPSFLCMRNLLELYNMGTVNGKMFVTENINNNVTSKTHEFYPDMRLMGAPKECEVLLKLYDFMQRTVSDDFTAQSVFLGEFNRWCNARTNEINIIDGKLVGIKTLDDTPILIDDLLSNNYINIYEKTYGIWIPSEQILKRRHYEWFARLSPKQVLESEVILSKYILLASAPNETQGRIEEFKEMPEWIGYWRVPSGFGLWGQKPNYLGNKMTITDPDYATDLV